LKPRHFLRFKQRRCKDFSSKFH